MVLTNVILHTHQMLAGGLKFRSVSSKRPNTSSSSRVAIVGGAGYFGSHLAQFLWREEYDVTVFDMSPNIVLPENAKLSVHIEKRHSQSLTDQELSTFGTVVFLGGCTGRASCSILKKEEVEKVNVGDVMDLIRKMSYWQHFISASTSAVLEGWEKATENTPINEDMLDAYSMSMVKRESMVREYLKTSGFSTGPRVTLLRFGTIVGNSIAQRTDLLFPKLFHAAYTTGFLKVVDHGKMRSFLTLQDAVRALNAILKAPMDISHRFHVWNLASFDATILKVASTVAMVTGATLSTETISSSVIRGDRRLYPYSNASQFEGFSLDCSSFKRSFNFSFTGTLMQAVNDFDQDVPESITPKGPHSPEIYNSGIACPVCGSTDHQLVLDLGYQPSANDFRTVIDDAVGLSRFPLKLVRCRICNHYHLSHIVDRGDLFEHYLYRSGTSETLAKYFDWLARKIVIESELNGQSGTILELACNDGSQLDQYVKHGWATFGVDPAENLAAIAREKNHTVKTGFWPVEFPELPRGNQLTAISAQNVLAHVPDVVAFLKGCADVMGEGTKLYIQTSQCNMHQLGQFDTIYHEHISFFTGHSFHKASMLSGLEIIKFETTPIHGESCLVTMQLKKNGTVGTLSKTIKDRLEQELRDGLTSDFFAFRFQAHVESIREWIMSELVDFRVHKYHVGAYGAAAKGMVLLHLMLGGQSDGTDLLDFTLDDAPLKQNTYCPSTRIPVLATNYLLQLDPTRPLVLLVFTWNFFHEIVERVKETVSGHFQRVYFIQPFPSPIVFRLDLFSESSHVELVREMPFHPTTIPNPLKDEGRKKVAIVTHQRNEDLMLPFFIMHHAPMVDEVLIIDYLSSDFSLSLIEKFAPPTWTVVNSTAGGSFGAVEVDTQVMMYEREKFANHWVVALTITEFFVQANLRLALSAELSDNLPTILKVPMYSGVGSTFDQPLLYYESLPFQRHKIADFGKKRGHRFMHYNTSSNYTYKVGRHDYLGTGAQKRTFSDGFIIKFTHSPWPEVMDRLMAVGSRVPENDGGHDYGFHHKSRQDKNKLIEEYNKLLVRSYDICEEDVPASLFYRTLKFRSIFEKMLGKCSRNA